MSLGADRSPSPRSPAALISCNLSKPDSVLDVIRKTYTNLSPTDAALLAAALATAGRSAGCIYDGQSYEWRRENAAPLVDAILREVRQLEALPDAEPEKKTAKAKAKAAEDETAVIELMLYPSQATGEELLGNREDLKTLLGDILAEGVEFLFGPTDIGWQWELERANWATINGGELRKPVLFRVEFTGPSIATEVGPGGKKRKARKR